MSSNKKNLVNKICAI